MASRYNFEIGKISEMLYQLKSNLLTPDFNRATQREILEDTHHLWLNNIRLRSLIAALKEDSEYWIGVARVLQSHRSMFKITESTQYAKHTALIERAEKEGM